MRARLRSTTVATRSKNKAATQVTFSSTIRILDLDDAKWPYEPSLIGRFRN
jgi:hypothetical protein